MSESRNLNCRFDTLCDMQSEPPAEVFEWLCARAHRWLPGWFYGAGGPRHALIGLIIFLHYLWVPPPLKSWHAAGLTDTHPCSMHLTQGPVPSECKEAVQNQHVAPSLTCSYSLFTPETPFFLWQFSYILYSQVKVWYSLSHSAQSFFVRLPGRI